MRPSVLCLCGCPWVTRMRCRRATALQLAASGKRAALVLFLIAALMLFLIAADATKTNKKGCAGPLSRSSPARLQLCRGGQ